MIELGKTAKRLVGLLSAGAVIMAVLSFMTATGGTANAASAYWPGAQQCWNTHCYSRAVDVHSDLIAAQTTIQSSWFSTEDQTLSPYETPVVDNTDCSGGTCPWNMSRELWLGDRSHWIEVGLRNGYENPQWTLPDGSPGCGCQAYYEFWEDGANSGKTSGATHVIANVTPDNTWHTYGIRRVSGQTFDVTVDGQVVGVSTASGASSFGRSAIGSETIALTTVQPLALMNQSCQSWSVEDGSGRWFGVGQPNHGLRGSNDNSGSPDQTYYGSWNSTTHQLCIGKASLPGSS
jgi:hypothetical protein